jgi:hypothetical protein
MRTLFTSLLLLPVATAFGQCIMSNANAPQSDPTNVEIGQSFMANCGGLLEYVEIYCATGGVNTAGQLRIYSGSTVTSTPIHTQQQPATTVAAGEAIRIYLSAPVTVTAFSSITFELPMSLEVPFSGGNPYPQGRMFYNGTNSSVYQNSDIKFGASIIPSCTNTTAAFADSGCQQYTAPSGALWTASGVYVDVIPNAQGCDSIITIDLALTVVDTSLVQDGPQLTVGEASATYQWIDCITGEPVDGATQQSITTELVGTYAVDVTVGNCTVRSACLFTGSTGMARTNAHLVPTDGRSTWRIQGAHAPQQSVVHDAMGRPVAHTLAGGVLQLHGTAPGVHFLRFADSSGRRHVLRFVVGQ